MITKTNLKLLLTVTVSAIFFSFSALKTDTANFSGTWSLNEGKSELGQFGARGVATKIVVDQKNTDLTTTRNSTSFNGDPLSTTETLTGDGKESETEVFNGAKKKSTLEWAADGQTFTIKYTISGERNGQSFEFKGSEKWAIGDGGKSLSLTVTISTPNGDFSTKAVYDKQ